MLNQSPFSRYTWFKTEKTKYAVKMTPDGAQTSDLYFYFREQAETLTRYEPFSLLSLIGEVGGFLGLFLGFSVYDVLAKGLQILGLRLKSK